MRDKSLWKKGLKVKTIEELKNFLKEVFRGLGVKVYLFGSRARGEEKPFSDIDLAIVIEKENEEVTRRITLLKFVLEEGNFPYEVDLVTVFPEYSLRSVVEKEGIRWV